MITFKANEYADWIGALASGLCLIHCAATPILFIAKACSSAASCCSDAHIWWKMIDFLFIIISFIAIYYSTKTTTKKWVVQALWTSWMLLLIVILSEAFALTIFPSSFSNLPAFAIIGLHIYNLKFCKCSDDVCCTNQNMI